MAADEESILSPQNLYFSTNREDALSLICCCQGCIGYAFVYLCVPGVIVFLLWIFGVLF